MGEFEAKLAGVVLDTAFKNRNQIVSALQDGLRRLKRGRLTVALFGLGGTGKTTTQKLLTEGIEKSAKNTAYIPTIRASKARVSGHPFVSVWDTPGQQAFREAAWQDATDSVAKSQNAVVVNIVSYGHNSLGVAPFADLRDRWPGRTKDEVIKHYFRHERRREIELLSDVNAALNDVRGRLHLLTVVNKQDLWWNRRKRFSSTTSADRMARR